MMRDLLARAIAVAFAMVLVIGGLLGAIAPDARGAGTSITATVPAAEERNVNVTAPISVTFSGPMDPLSVSWSVQPAVAATPSWSAGSTNLTLTPDRPLTGCVRYTVKITGNDSAGDPLVPGPVANPWSFSTASSRPCILSTNPADGQADVPTFATIATVVVEFSGPVDPLPLPLDAFRLYPYSGLYILMWGLGFATLSVGVFLEPCTTYEAAFSDQWGWVPGLVPNPWWFSTACPTVIQATTPANGSVAVPPATDPIQVQFSHPMDNTSVSWTIDPYVALDPVWSGNDTLLTLTHITPFLSMVKYTAEVHGNDTRGRPLAPGPVPNPWVFYTTCAPCYIVRTDPADVDTGVPLDKDVTVVFNRPPDLGTLSWTVTPAIAFTASLPTPTTLVLSHAAPFQQCTVYTVHVSATDLLPGPVPNPWSFTTRCDSPSAPLGLLAASGNRAVALSWSPPADEGSGPVTGYQVYRGTSPGTETWRANVSAIPLYVDTGLVNGQTYYYQVAAVNAFGEGPRSLEANATPENARPRCTIASPANGSSVSGTVEVNGTASDSDGSVERVEIRLDGGPWQSAAGTDVWTFAWGAGSAGPGPHTIEARAFDGEAYSDVALVTVEIHAAPGGPPPAPLYLVVGVGAVAVVALALLLLRRRRRLGARAR